MGAKKQRPTLRSSGQIESLEPRVMMSADPLGGFLGGTLTQHAFNDVPLSQHAFQDVEQHGGFDDGGLTQHVEVEADFHIDTSVDEATPVAVGDVDTALASAHNQSGLTNVRANYGFQGAGQTVAVIDSGIAYSHYALGGGYGAGYRVVGGWDFTEENDADPYDDGSHGSHGTHVAGIVGANTGSVSNSGVAPGVDLVGLRVFNDAGDGYFSWVENALQWVHDNKDTFANPITTVNLSLGTDWNQNTPPSWAMLEDEFAQLEADGIFIAVSAGNSFSSYNAPGLSYPAASSHVVPVMSVDDSGSLSYFSQRHDRAIAAPGRWIVSTVPDYKGNNNGIDDDWASFSGTSMAAPYLAGASVLVREAMEFVGQTNITQDAIYDHIRATADIFHDSATNADYHRLNLEAAIDALIPVDDYGSTVNTAALMGNLTNGGTFSGMIGKTDDIDYFTFTASSTGTASFTTSASHYLTANWQLDGGGGSTNGDVFSFDVVSGQSYTVGISTTDGVGSYDVLVAIDESFSAVDWGIVTFDQHSNLANAGETWYQFQANQAGFLTAEAFFNNAGGDVSLLLYNGQMQAVDSSVTTEDWERVDTYANAGDTFYLRVLGTNSDIDFRLTNLVSTTGSSVDIQGTTGDDSFVFNAGATHTLSVNGVEYSFAAFSNTTFTFHGSEGQDTASFTGTAGKETATLGRGQLALVGTGFSVTAGGIENAYVYGGGGEDTAIMLDSAGDDLLRTWNNKAVLSGGGFYNFAEGFGNTYAYATSGFDTVRHYDTAGNDLFRAWHNRSVMSGDGFYNYAQGFDETYAFSSDGFDTAFQYDSAGDDLYRAWDNKSVMSGDGFYNYAKNFNQTFAFASTGNDIVHQYDSAGNDLFRAWNNRSVLQGSGFYNYAQGFDQTYAYATSGYDTARMYDTAGDDLYRSWSDRSVLSGNGYYNFAASFDSVYAFASSGNDQAFFYDSAGDDLYRSWHNRAVMSGDGFYNYAQNFGQTFGYSSTGNDVAYQYDSSGDDRFRGWSDKSVLDGNGFYNLTQGFGKVYAFASSGYDTATLYDSAFDDLFRSWSDKAVMSGPGYYNYAGGFDNVQGTASSGNDQAILYDSAINDLVTAQAWGAFMEGGAYHNEARGFDRVEAQGMNGGTNTSNVQAVDYLFSLVGDWN